MLATPAALAALGALSGYPEVVDTGARLIHQSNDTFHIHNLVDLTVERKWSPFQTVKAVGAKSGKHEAERV